MRELLRIFAPFLPVLIFLAAFYFFVFDPYGVKLAERCWRRHGRTIGAIARVFLTLVACGAAILWAATSSRQYDLIPLPQLERSVDCSEPTCLRTATRAVRPVIDELEKTGKHTYSGQDSGAYCDLHAPIFSNPWLRYVASGAICLVVVFLSILVHIDRD
jgi:hypothetical protein